MKGRNLSRNSEESEKAIESYLCHLVREAGGIPLKYSSGTSTGYPDRLLLFPGGDDMGGGEVGGLQPDASPEPPDAAAAHDGISRQAMRQPGEGRGDSRELQTTENIGQR